MRITVGIVFARCFMTFSLIKLMRGPPPFNAHYDRGRFVALPRKIIVLLLFC